MMLKFGGCLWRWPCALSLSAALIFAAPAPAQTLTERLLTDGGDGRLDDLGFFAAALIVSGVENDDELGCWLDTYAPHRAEILRAATAPPGPGRLQALHAALHETLLTGKYQKPATDLRLALSRGDYNCLSSLAIYYELCQAAGEEVAISLRRGHVCLHSASGGQPIAIEPGATSWLAHDAASGEDSRQLTPVELLGKFYYNRGVQALECREFAAGIDRLQMSLLLDPDDDDARANLVAGINNWAVEHFRAKRYRDAAPLIEQGLALDPLFAPLVANERLVRAKLGQ